MRRFCQIVDEFTSDQNARHAQQGLIETARQGFWPVVKAPFGYEKYEAEWRGSKPKWKLRIEASEAAIEREINSNRKSAVEGKRVSVRVHHVGSRIIKKRQKKKN